jgi:decaprenyl-phosphate phosphoribosyltransferase
VYFVNDAADAGRDRLHPSKRLRPVASGRLPRAHALALAALGVAAAEAVSLCIGEPTLAALIGGYVALSVLYTLLLKHIPVAELAFVAGGFVLRALGGAAATHVPPSDWFLVVCSLGALMVAIAKRFTELAVLGADAAGHRPVMRWYSPPLLRLGQRMTAIVMITAYLLWAYGQHGGWTPGWHLASALPLAAALVRFDRLTARASGKPVEDLIARDGPMVCCELAWLVLFAVGL